MDPLTIALAAQGIWAGGKALGLWGKPPKYKRSDMEKEYMSVLETRAEEGIFSPQMSSRMINQATAPVRSAGNVAVNQVRGNVTRQGLENSAVMNQATSRVHSDVIGKIAQIAKGIAIKNEMANELSKVGAQDKLGQYGMRMSDIKNQNRMNVYNTRMSGIEGLFSAGTGLANNMLSGGDQRIKMLQTALQSGHIDKLSDDDIQFMIDYYRNM